MNVGIVAACMPIMKPFVRYVRARISGNDPHGLVRRSSSDKRTLHSHWYSPLLSLWPSRRSAETLINHDWTPRGNSPSDMRNFKMSKANPREPHRIGVLLPSAAEKEHKTLSLDLPLQGVPGDLSPYSKAMDPGNIDIEKAFPKILSPK